MADVVELGTEPQRLVPGPSGSLPGIDLTQSAGPALRAGAAIKMTPEGKISFLESMLGNGNVVTGPGGEVFVRYPDSKDFIPFDERGISFKDVTADMAGVAVEIAPMIAAGTNPFTVAGAGAAGNVARQGLSELLPGSDELSPVQRVLNVAESAALAGVSQAGSNILFKGIDRLKPRNFVARSLRKSAKSAFARQGARLEKSTGIPLTLGEFTGSRGALMIESIGRRTPGGADSFFQFGQKQIHTAVNKLRKIMDNINPETFGRFNIGQEVSKTFNNAVDTVMTARRAQAVMDFGVVDDLAGGRKILPVDNLIGAVDDLIRRFDIPGAGDAAQRVVSQAKKLKDTLIAPTSTPRELTADQTGRLLQIYTNNAAGSGVLFKDLEKSQSRFLAAKLKDALLKDMDDAIALGGDANNVMQALKVARSRYAKNSELVDEIVDSAIGRLLGNKNLPIEQLADRLVKMEPSTMAETVKILQKANPDTVTAIQRHFVQNALNRAVPPVGQGPAQGFRFSATRFVNALPDDDVLRSTGISREHFVEIKQVGKVLERIADKEFQGSPTAFAAITWDIVKGLFTLNPVLLTQGATALLAPKALSKAVLTPEGRAAIMTLSETSGATKKAVAAASLLATQIVTEPDDKNLRPMDQVLSQP